MPAVFRAIFGYRFLVFMVRVAGRRPGKQLSPAGFILIFFMGGLPLTPMIGNDRSIVNALIVIVTIAVVHYGIACPKQRSPTFGSIVDGTPLVVVNKGEWQARTMQKIGIH